MTALTDTGHITTRKLKGRTRRAVTLSTKITPQELELITAASEADGRALGEWVREVLLTEIHSPSIALGADQAHDRNHWSATLPHQCSVVRWSAANTSALNSMRS